jgi:hypothetical protein
MSSSDEMAAKIAATNPPSQSVLRRIQMICFASLTNGYVPLSKMFDTQVIGRNLWRICVLITNQTNKPKTPNIQTIRQSRWRICLVLFRGSVIASMTRVLIASKQLEASRKGERHEGSPAIWLQFVLVSLARWFGNLTARLQSR